MSSTPWFVYLIKSSDGLLYTGITTDVERRFREHQGLSGKNKGAKFFRGRSPVSIVYKETHKSRSQASRREAQIKKMSASAKQALFS
ncbi:MAG: GIY-YIG nuclease family protein [Pseudomonadales bacterium]